MPTERSWRWWHSVILLVIIFAILAVSELSLNRRLTWVFCLVLLALFAVIAGQGVTGYWWGIAIDGRNKVSLSRLQMIVWTIIVSSGLLSSALSNISLAEPGTNPLDINIPEQLLWLMGISTTSLVGSPLISSNKRKGRVAVHRSPGDARWIDIFMGEETSDSAKIDLAKVQMFFFTIVVMMAYGISMGVQLTQGGVITTLPPLDGSIVGLLGISHAGYLTNKGIPKGVEPPADQSVGTTPAQDAGPQA